MAADPEDVVMADAPSPNRDDDVSKDSIFSAKAPGGQTRKKRWDTSAATDGETLQEAETDAKTKKRSRFDQASTSVSKSKRSRWDQVPAPSNAPPPAEDGSAATPRHTTTMIRGRWGARILIGLSDEVLNTWLPIKGYEILQPPAGYEPRVPAARPKTQTGFTMQAPSSGAVARSAIPKEIPGVGELQFFKAEDMQFFSALADGADETTMDVVSLKKRKVLRLLLKIKNGTPVMRKSALRQMTDNAPEFGAEIILDQLLPILMERSLEDQERHLMIKVIDRVLYKLDDKVAPHTRSILIVVEPLLDDGDHYARAEARETVANLAKAVGLGQMISCLRQDIDYDDEFVRSVTARVFAIVAGALGIGSLMPFLKAVCKSNKSWQARHTGTRIVQWIAIQMGCGILPHLRDLVGAIEANLNDEQVKVRAMAALALAALAEASAPYGIEAFDPILAPLWLSCRKLRGKSLGSFIKAVGFIIPLMDNQYASYYTAEIAPILRREFLSVDDEMRRIVLKVLSQCIPVPGVRGPDLENWVVTDFFEAFWNRRHASEKRNSKQVIETTVVLGSKVGSGKIIERIVDFTKDENEPFRRMTMEAIEKLVSEYGTTDIKDDLVIRLVDGSLQAFQDQSEEDALILSAFSTIINVLGVRCKAFFSAIASTILFRLSHKSPATRMQAADLVARIAGVIKHCDEDDVLTSLSVTLYEYLGEEYPEVLGSVLGGLRSIVAVIGMQQIQPPIKDLLMRLTPILRNRHEKVQENCVELMGRIADRGPDCASPREWMRICFELLDMLKAHKKGIRRAANNTFGFIAKAIGPQDVLATLLNNLRVQERQSRVCTAVAIGIVAETCAPFSVLPALMNEYRVPELNVQNGVLKALSFMFEYIGEMAKDYVYAVVPLLEDALIERDQVHRQTAASVVKHLALGVAGLGCEDAMLHLLNLVHPNIFETSPHVIDRICEAIDALRVGLGTGVVMNHVWDGLFHQARKVRTPYWRLYNNAYIQSADSLVPYYPALEKVGNGRRHELEIVL